MSLIIDMLIALEFDLVCINYVNLPEKYHLTRGWHGQLFNTNPTNYE